MNDGNINWLISKIHYSFPLSIHIQFVSKRLLQLGDARLKNINFKINYSRLTLLFFNY